MDSRDELYLKVVLQRREGASDESIARTQGFGSACALWHRLAHEGYPVCAECGRRPDECGHKDTPTESEPRDRKPRGGGDRRKNLPSAADAAGLFRKALDKLVREVDELEHRREDHTGGRFVGTDVYEGSLLISREYVTPEYWQELRERYEEEAFGDGGDSFWLPSTQLIEPRGGDVSPVWPLPALIATYLLSGEPLEPLLEVMHPDPQDDADLEKLQIYTEGRKRPDGRDGLNVLARQVAALIRGDAPKRGTPPPVLTSEEHNVACSVTAHRKQGLSDAEIAEKFAHRGFTEHDIRRLGDFGLSWPQG